MVMLLNLLYWSNWSGHMIPSYCYLKQRHLVVGKWTKVQKDKHQVEDDQISIHAVPDNIPLELYIQAFYFRKNGWVANFAGV